MATCWGRRSAMPCWNSRLSSSATTWASPCYRLPSVSPKKFKFFLHTITIWSSWRSKLELNWIIHWCFLSTSFPLPGAEHQSGAPLLLAQNRWALLLLLLRPLDFCRSPPYRLCVYVPVHSAAWCAGPEGGREDLPSQHGATNGDVARRGDGIGQTCKESDVHWQQQCSGTDRSSWWV